MMINAKTGEIIAGVSLPDYNPNNKATITPDNMFNRFSLGVYEFGSIYKVLNATLAIENGIPISKRYDVKNDLVIDGKKISDMKKSRETMSLEEIVMFSSNIGSGRVLLDVGADKQREFYDAIGLTSRMNFELPERGKPIFPDKRNWRGMTAVTMAYGHGIATTQTAFLRGTCGVLNDGKMFDITLLKKRSSPYYTGYVISKNTSQKVKDLMRNVIEYGAGQRAKSKYYDIGGKSGTAIKILNTGGYSKGKNLLSFFAATPISDPEYAIIISLDEPKSDNVSRFALVGGVILGPVAKEIIESSAVLLGIENTKLQDSQKSTNDIEEFSRNFDSD